MEALRVCNAVIPARPVALHLPAVEIQRKGRAKEGKFFFQGADLGFAFVKIKTGTKTEDLFLDLAGQLVPQWPGIAVGVEDLKLVAPGNATFDRVDDTAGFVKNIIAVQPGKEALLE